MKAIKGLNCPGKTHSNDICQHPCIPWHSVGMICVSRELQPCSQKLGGYLHVIEYYVVSCTYTFLTKGSQVNCVEKLSELCRHLQRIARKPFPVTHSKICIFYMEVFTASFHLYSSKPVRWALEVWLGKWKTVKYRVSEKGLKSIPVHPDKAEISGSGWAESKSYDECNFSPFSQRNKDTLHSHECLVGNQTPNLPWCRTDCCCPSFASKSIKISEELQCLGKRWKPVSSCLFCLLRGWVH